MTGPKRHDYLPHYDTPTGIPRPGCHCGWVRPQPATSNGNARHEYAKHLEELLNEHEARLHEANVIMREAEILDA